MQTASIRKYALKEAVGNVVDVLDCDNGKFRFLINVNKTCDINFIRKK